MKVPLAGLTSNKPLKCTLCPYTTPARGSYRSRGRTHHWDGYDRLRSHVLGKHPHLANLARITTKRVPWHPPITRAQEAENERLLA